MEGKGPFLVIAPLTTLMHWQREVHKWTDMNAVVYDGSAADRAECQRWEFHFGGSGPRGQPQAPPRRGAARRGADFARQRRLRHAPRRRP